MSNPARTIGSMEHGKPFSVTESPLVDFDAVCQKVRAAIEPARAHAVSLHDEHGDVLWLSESSMGPDEHNAVREALETFSNIAAPPVLAFDLGDSRSAVLIRAVNSRRAMVGAVMVIMDTRGIKQDDKGVVKLMTPKLQRALSEFAGMRPDIEPPAAPAQPPAQAEAPAKPPSPPAPALALATAPRKPSPAPVAAPSAAPPAFAMPSATPAAPATPAARPAATARPATAAKPHAKPAAPLDGHANAAPGPVRPTAGPRIDPLELSLSDSLARHAPPAAAQEKRPTQSVTPEIDRLHAALRKSPIALHVQRLVPLTKGSQLKRYEVLLRSKADDAPNAAPHAMLKAAVEHGLGSMIDRRVMTELIGWLVHHPDVWQTHAVMFSVNLTTTALHDEHFSKFVGLCLAKSSLPKAMIGFEIDVATAIHLGDRISDIATALHKLGCPMILDDFGLRTECFDLLRLPGVRYIKLASEITAKMRSDKLSQAAITAVVQMARVLGMHTVAKRTETTAEQEWLTALGVDFIQSNAFSPSASIETLSKAKKAQA
jgi:EAL domain-containing protein (putative c-di-GMP-specific phosphodiesterase class I)